MNKDVVSKKTANRDKKNRLWSAEARPARRLITAWICFCQICDVISERVPFYGTNSAILRSDFIILLPKVFFIHNNNSYNYNFFISHYICHVHMRTYRYIILMLSVGG